MIGDVLTSSILFELIKTKYPNSELHYLINTHTYPVVENNPYIDKFVFYTPQVEKSKLRLYTFLQHIKRTNYDVVIDVYSKLSSNLITTFSGAKTKISKYKNYTAFLYDFPIKYNKVSQTTAGLAIENRIQLLSPLGIEIKTPLKPKIYLTKDERNKAADFLKANNIDLGKPIYMISVLGSGPLKSYPFDYMAKTLDFIAQHKNEAQILFNYIPKQIDDAKSIYDQCNPQTQSQIFFDVFGKGLREFLALTSYCSALIGNEGGAVNMAKALNIPTFTIFSPWIKKEDWSIFEDGKSNVSVHLKDFMPERFEKPEDHYKKTSLELYKLFKPELFSAELELFLNKINA